jgi:hypothetical protein
MSRRVMRRPASRGGYEVDLAWKEGRVTRYEVRSEEPREVTVRVGDKTERVRTVAWKR